MKRTTLHIIGGDSRVRAELGRIAFALGHHAEVYADLDELLERPPQEGIVVAGDGREGRADARDLIRRLGESGLSLPAVMASPDPALEQVLAAIKAGALDYLRLPLEIGSLAHRLDVNLAEADQHGERRRREIKAQQAISLLSRREREVLQLLSAGCSNKEIARSLQISPRTVEIHRGKMMTKLGAGHAADAVRVWIDAQLEIPALPSEKVDRSGSIEARVAGRIGERPLPAYDQERVLPTGTTRARPFTRS